MNEIYIKFMSDAVLETLKENTEVVLEGVRNNPQSTAWIKDIFSGEEIYTEKKYLIPEFELELSQEGNYKDVDFQNSIKLYESLKRLPRHILTDERFWAWINFDKCYSHSLQAMPVKEKTSTLKNHYFFTQGARRGLFFGVMSRCYFRVELSVDETLEDEYELTRFVIENPERIRNLTWRSFSSQKHIVLGVLKAEKRACDEFGDKLSNSIYTEIAKYVSRIGSVRLIDAISEIDMQDMVYRKIKKIIDIGEGHSK